MTLAHDVNSPPLTNEAVHAEIEAQLRRFRVPYTDIYLAWRPSDAQIRRQSEKARNTRVNGPVTFFHNFFVSLVRLFCNVVCCCVMQTGNAMIGQLMANSWFAVTDREVVIYRDYELVKKDQGCCVKYCCTFEQENPLRIPFQSISTVVVEPETQHLVESVRIDWQRDIHGQMIDAQTKIYIDNPQSELMPLLRKVTGRGGNGGSARAAFY